MSGGSDDDGEGGNGKSGGGNYGGGKVEDKGGVGEGSVGGVDDLDADGVVIVAKMQGRRGVSKVSKDGLLVVEFEV